MTNPTSISAPPALPFIDIEREFDASVQAVFRAHTDAALFARWTGPRSMQMESVALEPTTGGRWHYAFRGEGDALFSFSGVRRGARRGAGQRHGARRQRGLRAARRAARGLRHRSLLARRT
jgi:hypothetical protein